MITVTADVGTITYEPSDAVVQALESVTPEVRAKVEEYLRLWFASVPRNLESFVEPRGRHCDQNLHQHAVAGAEEQ